MEQAQLHREKERIFPKEQRNETKCKGGMNEFTKAFSFLMKLKLIHRLAMRAKVTASISLVPSMVHLVWYTWY